jgi:hypothetical protein
VRAEEATVAAGKGGDEGGGDGSGGLGGGSPAAR